MLSDILLHAYENVPYYRRVLSDSGVVRDGTVVLAKFDNIRCLTKDIIRTEGDNLYAVDHKSRRSFVNTSGGSTGEPVSFLQDANYSDWQMGMRFYFRKVKFKFC